jgi:class 3 adenylate cyclase
LPFWISFSIDGTNYYIGIYWLNWGNIGAPSRINYTVVGDTVNTTQRLESLGKEVDPDAEVIVLLSATTKSRLPDDFKMKPAGSFQVKGKEAEVEVFRLLE